MTASSILCKQSNISGKDWPVVYIISLFPSESSLLVRGTEAVPETRGDIKEARGLDAILTDSREECIE